MVLICRSSLTAMFCTRFQNCCFRALPIGSVDISYVRRSITFLRFPSYCVGGVQSEG